MDRRHEIPRTDIRKHVYYVQMVFEETDFQMHVTLRLYFKRVIRGTMGQVFLKCVRCAGASSEDNLSGTSCNTELRQGYIGGNPDGESPLIRGYRAGFLCLIPARSAMHTRRNKLNRAID